MLVNLKRICQIADEANMAAGAFNITSIDALRAVIDAAEELNVPVIAQYAQVHECYNSFEDLAALMLKYAERASVPVCVHLDHGEDLDYLEKALDLGAGGIMYDGSVLPYEQNLENTAKAVEMAKKYNAGVEAELGCMGERESGSGNAGENESKIYTDPDLASSFIEATGIDALACSFGTTHGIYLSKPRLNFDIVRSVREKTGGIPVVMHGGSGVSAEDFRNAINAGVRKINYFTYMDMAGAVAARENLEGNEHPLFADITIKAREAMKANCMEAMKVFANK